MKDVNKVVDSILNGDEIRSSLDVTEASTAPYNAATIVKIVSELEEDFTSDDLETAIGKYVKDEEVATSLYDVFVEIEEDGGISELLDLDPAELKEWAADFCKDMADSLDEGKEQPVDEQIEPITEANSGSLASAIVKAIKGVKSDSEWEAAIKKVVKDPTTAEAVYEYLIEIEEEDGMVSSIQSGDISDKEAAEVIKSFLDDGLTNEAVSGDALVAYPKRKFIPVQFPVDLAAYALNAKINKADVKDRLIGLVKAYKGSSKELVAALTAFVNKHASDIGSAVKMGNKANSDNVTKIVKDAGIEAELEKLLTK